MRTPLLNFLLLVAIPSTALAQQESPGRAEWGQWARAFSLYASDPTPGHADALRDAVLTRAAADTLATPPPFDSLQSWLAVLTRRAQAGDPAAVRVAFVLDDDPGFGGGDVGESLDIVLGTLLRTGPRLFLVTLKDEERRIGRRLPLGGLVGNLGEEFVDRMQAQCRELRRRTLSVQAVRDSALAGVRGRVVASLGAAAEQRCGP